MSRFYAGEDHGNFSGHYPMCGRFIPHFGQRFIVVEWRAYRHSDERDHSYVHGHYAQSAVFECQGIRLSSRAVFPYADVDAVRVGDGALYTFNTNIVKLAPYIGQTMCACAFTNCRRCATTAACMRGVPTADLPCANTVCTASHETDRGQIARLRDDIEAKRRENERLRAEAGHRETRIRNLESRVREYERQMAQIRSAPNGGY